MEAIELIYRESFDRFVAIAQTITRSREGAVDAVQEAFATALRRRSDYRASGPLEGWIWRAVVNASIRSLRDRRHVRQEALASSEDTQASDDGLRRMVSALPDRQRLVLFLRYYADLDYRSIAHALDMEIGTVGATLNHAHAALKLQIAEGSTA